MNEFEKKPKWASMEKSMQIAGPKSLSWPPFVIRCIFILIFHPILLRGLHIIIKFMRYVVNLVKARLNQINSILSFHYVVNFPFPNPQNSMTLLTSAIHTYRMKVFSLPTRIEKIQSHLSFFFITIEWEN